METPSASPYLHDKGNDKEWNHRGGCTPPCNIGCAAHHPWCTLLWPQEGKTTCDWGGLLPRLLQYRPFQTSDPLGPRSWSISPLDKGIFSQLAAYNRIPSMGRQPASGWGQPHCYRIHYLLEYSIYMPCAHQGLIVFLEVSETGYLLARHAQKDLCQGAFLQWELWSSKWATGGLDPRSMGLCNSLGNMQEACWCSSFESSCSKVIHSSRSASCLYFETLLHHHEQKVVCLLLSGPPLAFCQGSSFCQGRGAAAICHPLLSPLAAKILPALWSWTILQSGLGSYGSGSKKEHGEAIWWHIQWSPCHSLGQCRRPAHHVHGSCPPGDKNAPSGPCVLTPYCSQSFHFWQVLPTPHGQPHQGLHSGPILAQLQQTTCLCSKAGGALYTELIGFETLLTRAYGFLSPCLSAILLISWQLVPWDLLSRTQVHYTQPFWQELDQPFWQELDKNWTSPFDKSWTKAPSQGLTLLPRMSQRILSLWAKKQKETTWQETLQPQPVFKATWLVWETFVVIYPYSTLTVAI